jgi:putative transposase
MARIARLIVPGLPHHVTQRGNRRERIFFSDDDYALYRGLLASQCRKQGVACQGSEFGLRAVNGLRKA